MLGSAEQQSYTGTIGAALEWLQAHYFGRDTFVLITLAIHARILRHSPALELHLMVLLSTGRAGSHRGLAAISTELHLEGPLYDAIR